jgi:hypothetical protein
MKNNKIKRERKKKKKKTPDFTITAEMNRQALYLSPICPN